MNEINLSEKTEDLFLTKHNDEYILELLDKCGSPRQKRPVKIILKFHSFSDEYRYTLQTDINGRIHLGNLKQVAYLQSEIDGETLHTWEMQKAFCSWPPLLHTTAGEKIDIPYLMDIQQLSHKDFSLFELRNSDYFKDCFKSLSIKNGFLSVKPDHAGDYELYLKQYDQSIKIRVAERESTRINGYIMDKHRHLQVTGTAMLNIVSVKESSNYIKIQLKNTSGKTRIHLFSTNFLPSHSVFNNLGMQNTPISKMNIISDKKSVYISGRDIGDEYRYILDRNNSTKYPGNLLQKPELLLTPWAIGKTEAERENIRDEEKWGGVGESPPDELVEESGTYHGQKNDGINSYSCFDFLNRGTGTHLNLRPDNKGIISIPIDNLNKKNLLHIIAVDKENSVYRMISRKKVREGLAECSDLKLQSGLNPEKHYTQKNYSTIIAKNSDFTIKDLFYIRICNL